MITLINEATASGARKAKACEVLNLELRTVQRWIEDEKVKEDQRTIIEKAPPSHKLSEFERQEIIRISNEAQYASLPPSQIVPKLADNGIYIASESSFYRIFREKGMQHHRGRSKAPRKTTHPTTHIAYAPNEVWSWDISYLPSGTKGLYHYLYLVLDIYSRKIVAWEVHESELGTYAAALIERAILNEKCTCKPLILHSDNGSPMKSQTFAVKLAELGIAPSYSRPRVSNDNPYSEAMFRTLKYCPKWPTEGFKSLDEARGWVLSFVHSYNEEHRHSGIKFVTPGQRHRGEDKAILIQRGSVYEAAKANNKARWSGNTRNWEHINAVALNPEKLTQKNAL